MRCGRDSKLLNDRFRPFSALPDAPAKVASPRRQRPLNLGSEAQAFLVDERVGAGQQYLRHVLAERLCRLQIDREFEFDG